ncbi:MAG: hypothetical protein FWD18_06740 [Micrococcales bacterium]|nr:hypothetical protein [Micrococcales bacterium]
MQVAEGGLPSEWAVYREGLTGSGSPTVARCQAAIDAIADMVAADSRASKEKLEAREEQLAEGAYLLMRADHAADSEASQLAVEQAVTVITRNTTRPPAAGDSDGESSGNATTPGAGGGAAGTGDAAAGTGGQA